MANLHESEIIKYKIKIDLHLGPGGGLKLREVIRKEKGTPGCGDLKNRISNEKKCRKKGGGKGRI